MPAEKEEVWLIAGSNGTLSLRMVPGDETKIVFCEGVSDKGAAPKVVWEGRDGFGSIGSLALDDFASAAMKKSRPRTGLEESLVIQRITDAVYKSAEVGGAVSID